MSRRRRAKEQAGLDPAARQALRRRRLALGLYLLLLVACVVGSQTEWYQAMLGERPFGDPRTGAGDWRGSLGLGACIVAFFFASYDLVADADFQLPVLLASLVALGAAGKVFYDVYGSDQLLASVVEDVERARLLGRATDPSGVAAVTSAAAADPLRGALPGLRFRWGFAAFLSGALCMVLVSSYLTFVAERDREERRP